MAKVTSLMHDDKIIRVNSVVEVQGPGQQQWVMLLTKLYQVAGGEWRMSGTWFYRPEDEEGLQLHCAAEAGELFISNHVNSNAVSCVLREVAVVSWSTFKRNKAVLAGRAYYVRKFYDVRKARVMKIDYDKYVCRLAGLLGQPSAHAPLPSLPPQALHAAQLLQKLQRRLRQTDRSPYLKCRQVMSLSEFEVLFQPLTFSYCTTPNRSLKCEVPEVTALNYLFGPCDTSARTGWCYSYHPDKGMLVAIVTHTMHGAVPITVSYFFASSLAELTFYIAVYGDTIGGWREQVSM